MNLDQESPWNPGKPVDITPEQFELEVIKWLGSSGKLLNGFKVMHRQKLSGSGGDYEFDAVVDLVILGGCQITVVVECKRYSRPIERDEINSIYAKSQDVGAQKAMVCSTSGFQKGAIKYATSKNIALVDVVDGGFHYRTRSAIVSQPPPWADLPIFAGNFVRMTKDGDLSFKAISTQDVGALNEWIQS